MDHTFEDIKEDLEECITYISPEHDMILIENSPYEVGFYGKSDIVMTFDENGKMMLCTERISAAVVIVKFFLCKLKSYAIKDRENDDIDTVVTHGISYVDVTRIRQAYKTFLNLCEITVDYEEIERKLWKERVYDLIRDLPINFDRIEAEVRAELQEGPSV
jgi:hypothetical protein